MATRLPPQTLDGRDGSSTAHDHGRPLPVPRPRNQTVTPTSTISSETTGNERVPIPSRKTRVWSFFLRAARYICYVLLGLVILGLVIYAVCPTESEPNENILRQSAIVRQHYRSSRKLAELGERQYYNKLQLLESERAIFRNALRIDMDQCHPNDRQSRTTTTSAKDAAKKTTTLSEAIELLGIPQGGPLPSRTELQTAWLDVSDQIFDHAAKMNKISNEAYYVVNHEIEFSERATQALEDIKKKEDKEK